MAFAGIGRIEEQAPRAARQSSIASVDCRRRDAVAVADEAVVDLDRRRRPASPADMRKQRLEIRAGSGGLRPRSTRGRIVGADADDPGVEAVQAAAGDEAGLRAARRGGVNDHVRRDRSASAARRPPARTPRRPSGVDAPSGITNGCRPVVRAVPRPPPPSPAPAPRATRRSAPRRRAADRAARLPSASSGGVPLATRTQPSPEPGGDRGRRPRVIRLDAAARDQRVGALAPRASRPRAAACAPCCRQTRTESHRRA